MNNKHLIAINLSALIGIAILCAVLWQAAHQQQEITILNKGKQHYWVAYYSSINGEWLKGKTQLTKAGIDKAVLRNQDMLHSAHYQVAIGHANQYDCIANIEQPALKNQPKFISHQGNCETVLTNNGKLTLVIDKASFSLQSAHQYPQKTYSKL